LFQFEVAQTTSSAFRKNDFSVLRRYSHFVWLYEALVQNNPGVIVPGMPEKHAIGSSSLPPILSL
jgi:sorting nexin-1/2